MSAHEVDEYIAAVGEPKRATLEEMRRRILAVIPDTEQTISYGCPAFKVRGKTIAGLAAFKQHLSYLPHSGSTLAEVAAHTGAYTQTRSALLVVVDEPLPQALIEKSIAARPREAGIRICPCARPTERPATRPHRRQPPRPSSQVAHSRRRRGTSRCP